LVIWVTLHKVSSTSRPLQPNSTSNPDGERLQNETIWSLVCFSEGHRDGRLRLMETIEGAANVIEDARFEHEMVERGFRGQDEGQAVVALVQRRKATSRTCRTQPSSVHCPYR
jgi:hypothetical protein